MAETSLPVPHMLAAGPRKRSYRHCCAGRGHKRCGLIDNAYCCGPAPKVTAGGIGASSICYGRNYKHCSQCSMCRRASGGKALKKSRGDQQRVGWLQTLRAARDEKEEACQQRKTSSSPSPAPQPDSPAAMATVETSIDGLDWELVEAPSSSLHTGAAPQVSGCNIS